MQSLTRSQPRTRRAAAPRRVAALSSYFYAAPALAFLGLFVFWPLLQTGWISLHEWNLVAQQRTFVGLQNYRELLTDASFRGLLLQSAMYVLFALIGNVLLPVGLALLTLQVGEREADLYQSLLFFPTVIAVSVGTLIWLWFYLPAGGVFNAALGQIGVRGPNWLNDPAWALPSVALVTAWKFLGFNYLVALAGLRAIGRDVLEAAHVDGASGFRLLRGVILPLFAPSALFLFVSAVLSSLDQAFVPIDVLTAGGPAGSTSNLMYVVYQDAFKFFRAGRASAEAVVLIATFAVFVVWQFRMIERRVSYER